MRRTFVWLTVALGCFVALGWSLPDRTPESRPVIDPPAARGAPLTPTQALALWSDFPLGQDERPTVVFEPVRYSAPFRDGPRQAGFLQGRWSVPERLPEAPARMDGYTVRSAREAVQVLREAVRDDPRRVERPGAELKIVDVRLTRRTFETDRGRISLPAWTVTFGNDFAGPATVLAVRGNHLYEPPGEADAQGDVTLSSDGLRLTYSFLGAGPGEGNCRSDYTPLIQESRTAVAVGAMEHPRGHNRNATCSGAQYTRTVSAELTRPLGDRVVITWAHGAPLPVRPDGTYRWYRP